MPDSLDLDSYSKRIDYRGAFEPSLQVLHDLHVAHTAHIPFENIDILLGRPITLDLTALEAKIVRDCRGGYCFEQNTLFAGVLEQLGFTVTTLAARVRLGRTRISPRTHMLLLVEVERQPFLADVGFGGDGFIEPMALEADHIIEQFGWFLRLVREEQSWILQSRVGGAWLDQYEFTLERHYPSDYEVANHYTATFPSSYFRQMPLAHISTANGRRTLRNLTLTEAAHADSEPISRTIEEAELPEVLADCFGLRLAPGTRIPVAPG